ncbi:hypothetical protein HanRHA438_Chr06g0273511 [Helianthus annuus]|uniref:Uncharacterized protein n=1 Tax=Helianthus annuus TaxID=4232 RepID=A0A9K3NJR6_HELAN|nr:hypothetical protein HanXRQr2_Chr06g0264241 [Helianthus annuus]KAJ0912369.1 hypothetical protein HanRHA438_Chr06g0273511 [Helianthus annuus]
MVFGKPQAHPHHHSFTPHQPNSSLPFLLLYHKIDIRLLLDDRKLRDPSICWKRSLSINKKHPAINKKHPVRRSGEIEGERKRWREIRGGRRRKGQGGCPSSLEGVFALASLPSTRLA